MVLLAVQNNSRWNYSMNPEYLKKNPLDKHEDHHLEVWNNFYNKYGNQLIEYISLKFVLNRKHRVTIKNLAAFPKYCILMRSHNLHKALHTFQIHLKVKQTTKDRKKTE